MSLVTHVGRRIFNCRIRPSQNLPTFFHTTPYIQPATVKMAYDRAYVQSHTPADYQFPSHRLTTCPKDREPIVLLACGSFSPITYLHLRMFSMAQDYAASVGFHVVGGILSPVSDNYKKKGLAPARHRVEMCKLAAEKSSKSLIVDPWEANSPTYIPTARVLDHVDYEINEVMGGIECADGSRKRSRIVLLAGLDLIQTMSAPGVWDEGDLSHILNHYGVFAVERTGTETSSALANLKQWEHNIHIIRQVITNDISSTKIRLLLKRNMTIDYLIPDEVINYIYEHNLYRDGDPSGESKGQDIDKSNNATAGSSTS